MTKEEIIRAAERLDDPDGYHNFIGANRAPIFLGNGRCEICDATIVALQATIDQAQINHTQIKWHIVCRPCLDVIAIHFNAPIMGRFKTERDAKRAYTAITDMRPGDYVKDLGGVFHEIKEVWGVNGNKLAKPSEGGFGCITTDGLRIDMWHAKAYVRREDYAGKS